jgi:Peptidase A4 family
MRRAIVAGALIAAAAAAVSGLGLTLPVTANASTPPISSRSDHWAGYWAAAPTGSTIVSAQSEMIVPRVNCSLSRGTAPYEAAFWVGLGGDQDGSSLVQTGVFAFCATLTSKPEFALFFEVWPQQVIQLGWPGYNDPIHVHPGDTVSMNVYSPAITSDGKYVMSVTTFDPATGLSTGHYEKHRSPSTITPAVGTTAEAIAERPFNGKTQGYFGLAGFGKTTFFNAILGLSPAADHETLITQNKVTMFRWHSLSKVNIVTASAPYDSSGGQFPSDFTVQRTTNW